MFTLLVRRVRPGDHAIKLHSVRSYVPHAAHRVATASTTALSHDLFDVYRVSLSSLPPMAWAGVIARFPVLASALRSFGLETDTSSGEVVVAPRTTVPRNVVIAEGSTRVPRLSLPSTSYRLPRCIPLGALVQNVVDR